MYYKVIKNNVSFNDAIEAFKNKNVIKDEYSNIYDPNEKDLNDLKFSIDQIQSNSWNILVLDNEMNLRLAEIRDIMHKIDLNIDSRFYDEDKMDIEDYWILFEHQFIKDELAYHIMKWFYYNYNKKIK